MNDYEQPFTDEELEQAREACMDLLQSARGDYILSQALHYGIKALESVDPPHQEVSNLADMRLLLLQFPGFAAAESAMSGKSMTDVIAPAVHAVSRDDLG